MSFPIQPLQKESNSRFHVWLDQAHFDLEASKISEAGKFYEWSCYQSTQSVEKALKGLISFAKWQPPRTHKLSVLIGICNNVHPGFRNFKFSYRDLEIYTFVSRYPFLLPGEKKAPHYFITEENSNKCTAQASVIAHEIIKLTHQETTGEYEDFEGFGNINLSNRLENVVNKITEEFDTNQIILFGGYAKGKKTISTIDLLVIANTNLDFIERIQRVREITKGGIPVVEALIYTPEELETMLITHNDPFVNNAVKNGKVIFEKKY